MAFGNKLFRGEEHRAMACRVRGMANTATQTSMAPRLRQIPGTPNLGDMCSISSGYGLCLQHVIFCSLKKLRERSCLITQLRMLAFLHAEGGAAQPGSA